MNLARLQEAVTEIKTDIEAAITSAAFNSIASGDGQRAKEALIRSARLIQKIHEVTKESLHEILKKRYTPYVIHPPLGQSSPESDVVGFKKRRSRTL